MRLHGQLAGCLAAACWQQWGCAHCSQGQSARMLTAFLRAKQTSPLGPTQVHKAQHVNEGVDVRLRGEVDARPDVPQGAVNVLQVRSNEPGGIKFFGGGGGQKRHCCSSSCQVLQEVTAPCDACFNFAPLRLLRFC